MERILTIFLSGFKLLLWHILSEIYLCHLPIDTEECGVVTVGAEGVGTGDGVLPCDDGKGCLMEVTVGTAEKVAGAETLVGGAVAIVIIHGLAQEGVGGEGYVVLVLLLGFTDNLFHPRPLPCAAHEEGKKKESIVLNGQLILTIENG